MFVIFTNGIFPYSVLWSVRRARSKSRVARSISRCCYKQTTSQIHIICSSSLNMAYSLTLCLGLSVTLVYSHPMSVTFPNSVRSRSVRHSHGMLGCVPQWLDSISKKKIPFFSLRSVGRNCIFFLLIGSVTSIWHSLSMSVGPFRWSVCHNFLKGRGELHFHAPIGALV